MAAKGNSCFIYYDTYHDTFYRKLLEVHAGRHGRCHVFYIYIYEVAYVLAEIINI
jgi:hypothetical protein